MTLDAEKRISDIIVSSLLIITVWFVCNWWELRRLSWKDYWKHPLIDQDSSNPLLYRTAFCHINRLLFNPLSAGLSNYFLFNYMISQVISGKFSLDVDKLLQDCRILPSPQDLRYAVFAAGASQHSVESLKKDLPVLRKSCIVRVLGPLRFEMGLPNSITAVISVHECYPEVLVVLPFIWETSSVFICLNLFFYPELINDLSL